MTHLVRHPAAAGMSLFCLVWLLSHSHAHAQAAPSGGASAPGGTEAHISDRVKKDAASPLYWIRLNAQKSDGTTAPKAAPRIAEIRPARPAPTAAPATGGGAMAVATGGGSAATPSPTVPSSGPLPSTNEAAATLAAPAPLAAPSPAAANLAGAVGAGMVAPAASSAAEAARTAAAAAEPEEALALVKADEPEFPVIVMRRVRKGNVQVRFDVQPDGSVANATVVQTTARSLNDAALEAVRAWQFKPVSSTRSAIVDLGFDLDS
jgi:TonB family protein